MRLHLLIICTLLANTLLSQEWEQVGNIQYSIECLYTDTIDGSLYVGGEFHYFNGIDTRGIFRFDNTGAVHALGTGQDNCDNYTCTPVKAITRYKNEIYIGWVDATIGGGVVVNSIARWDGQQWKALQNGFNAGAVVNSFLEKDGSLYIAGGLDIMVDSVLQYSIVRWDGNNWEGYAFPVYHNDYPIAQGVLWYKGKLYVGGGFQFGEEDDSFTLDIASFDGQTWKSVGGGIKGVGLHGINSMVIFKDELYVCGKFLTTDGNAGNKIMRWDGEQWKDVGGGICDVGGIAHKMLVHDDKLYVVGIFSCVGDGVPASCIASWDGERWCSVGSGVFNNKITAIEFWQGDLYIGGGFTKINGQPVEHFAKYIGDQGTTQCSEPVNAVEAPPTADQLHIYPNPVKDQLTITGSLSTTWRIFNAAGQEVTMLVSGTGAATAQPLVLDVGKLPAGWYYWQGMGAAGLETGRFLKW